MDAKQMENADRLKQWILGQQYTRHTKSGKLRSRDRAAYCFLFFICFAISASISSVGLSPTRITTAPWGNLKPALNIGERIFGSLYTDSGCTPQNRGPSGGPKSICKRFTTAIAALPDGDCLSSIRLSSLKGDSSSVNIWTPLRMTVSGIGVLDGIGFHPELLSAWNISPASCLASESDFEATKNGVPAYFRTSANSACRFSLSPSRSPITIRRSDVTARSRKLEFVNSAIRKSLSRLSAADFASFACANADSAALRFLFADLANIVAMKYSAATIAVAAVIHTTALSQNPATRSNPCTREISPWRSGIEGLSPLELTAVVVILISGLSVAIVAIGTTMKKAKYKEGEQARDNFEKAMNSIFKAPKQDKKKQEPKAPASEKSSDADDKD